MNAKDTKASILIVDDIPENIQVLSRLLIREGYHVHAAVAGLCALDIAQADPPDLILLDILMPDMDGYQTCAQLKANPQTRDIPVIFISALGETIDKVQAFAIGGLDYVTKPFHPEEVLARVQTHLSLRRLQLDLEQRNTELQQALATIKTLSGLIPICAWCGNKIQDENEWVNVETYIETHSDARFTHGICPDCLETFKSRE